MTTVRELAQKDIEELQTADFTDSEKVATAIFALAHSIRLVFGAGGLEPQPAEALVMALRDGLDKLTGAISDCAANIESTGRAE